MTVLEQKLAKLENGHLGANSLSDFLTFLALLGGNRVINHNKYGNVVNLMPQAYHLGMIFDICGNWGWFIVGFTAPAAMVSCNIHPLTQGETEVFPLRQMNWSENIDPSKMSVYTFLSLCMGLGLTLLAFLWSSPKLCLQCQSQSFGWI